MLRQAPNCDPLPCLGGRSEWPSPPEVPQLFAAFGNPAGGDLTVPVLRPVANTWTPPVERQRQGSRLWSLASWVRERVRSGGPFSPFSRTQIMSNDTFSPAAPVSDRSMAYKLRLSLSGDGMRRSVLVDPGQPLEFYAVDPAVELLGPNGAVEVTPDGPAPAQLSGFVLDTLVGVRLMQIEESIGATDAIYSQIVTIAGGSTANVEVPPGARSVQIYQGTTGATAPTAWRQFYGNPALGVGSVWEIGTLPFIAGTRMSEPGALLPQCTHLLSDSNADAVRQFSIVWTIRP